MAKEVILSTPEGLLEVEWVEGEPFIHLELYVWSREALREYKRVWEVVKEGFSEAGHDGLFVVIPKDDPKLLKFERMFGFEIAKEEPTFYIMYQEI